MEPYRVPFLFDRSRAPVYRLTNVGEERLRGLSVALLGPGLMSPTLPGRLEPGASIEIRIHGTHLAVDGRLVVRWVRETGDDYLWRVAL